MNFEVYCDESCLEALTNKDAHEFVGIGGLWLPASCREELKQQLKVITAHHGITGEFKWKKVSPRYFDFYKGLIDYFFKVDYLRFRIVLIEAKTADNARYNGADNELSFYKFYYQLLHHWIFDFNEYDIFLDYKINRNKGRLIELQHVLDQSNLTSKINQVQGIPSEQSLGIQLADFFTGMVTAKMNNEITSQAKKGLIRYTEEQYLRKAIAPTPKWEEKFNIFKMNLRGGW